jgi:flavin reductase (DIM6/NTAB) family NADH-FMN oxidoreductase RutF
MQEVDWAKGVQLGSPYAYVLAVTVNAEGVPNVMGVGWWCYLSAKPKLLGMAIATQRYTHDCLQDVPEFTLCFPGKELALPAWRCGQVSGRAVNKFEELGLTALPSKHVRPPIIDGSTVAFECKVANVVPAGDHLFYIGEILAVHGDLQNREHLFTESYSRLVSLSHDGKVDWKLEETLGLPNQLSR